MESGHFDDEGRRGEEDARESCQEYAEGKFGERLGFGFDVCLAAVGAAAATSAAAY